jgi:hypothetical protein
VRLRGLSLVVLSCLALTAGCSDHTPRSPGEAASPPLRPVSDDVKRAYMAYWTAWLKANRTSNPHEPSLAEHAAGRQLDLLRANLAAARQRKEVAKGTVGHRLEGMELDGDAGRVVDCVDLDKWFVYDAVTDKPIEQLIDKPSQLGVFILTRQGGSWRVTGSQVAGEC